ncbi:glycosyltransferase family 39 protein [Phototrophicus methaneseepsis]|uniref:Glycosyltransferase family 39 protein n=1 Tax=Phototrophicus methaneseepsis TaxID=2710758 RepID=A0A7S8E944_9CHLR|nr:glycosyltransferase family 39 protein [Phototrophicus methaneseepsis]QPC82607.1 glycosyltransferase family 39 protein [Phototrophicus methaneseepsis]
MHPSVTSHNKMTFAGIPQIGLSHKGLILLLLLAILLLAAFTRIYAIDAQSLWIDEGFTWYLTQSPDPFLILRNDVHPPLYFLLADVWVALTGDSVLAMRFLSTLPSLVSIAVMFHVARELERWRGTDSGGLIPVLAALMLALADAENFLAQDVRSYTLQTTFILLSMWGMLRWARRGGRGWLVLWVLSMAALVYTFYLAALVGVVQGIWILLFLRGRKRIIGVGALVVAALLVVPWLLLSLGQQSDNLSYADWIRLSRHGFGVIVDMVYRWFGRMWPLTGLLALLALVHIDYSPHVWRIQWRRIAPAVLLVMWLLLPLVIMFIANERVPLYQPRRVNFITGAVALLIAFGLGNIQRPARWLLIAAIVIYGVTTIDFWRDKQPWRVMAAETAPLIHEDAALLIELGGDDYAPLYHYTHTLPDTITVRGLTSWRKFQPETYEAGLPALIDAHNTIWFFYWGKDTSALDWLDELNFQRTEEITVDFNPDVYLWRYDRLPQQPLVTYENGLLLRDAAYFPDLHADLLWSTEAPLEADYTASIFLLNNDGQLVAQQDAPPDERPTSQWDADSLVYDARQIHVIEGTLPPGDYQVGVVVYRVEGETLTRLLTDEGADSFVLGTLHIE